MKPIKNIKLSTINCGLKYKDRDDLLLVELPENTAVAGVFTKSSMAASSIRLCQKNLLQQKARALIVNAGNANAFTGIAGVEATQKITQELSKIINCPQSQIFMSSTGVIGERLKDELIIAALPDFRKLYGHIGGPLKKGDVISFTVQSNYNVGNWDGTKAIVLSEKYALGLPNDGLGIAYTVSGSICLVVAFIFLLKQLLAPRAIGSPELLNWK